MQLGNFKDNIKDIANATTFFSAIVTTICYSPHIILPFVNVINKKNLFLTNKGIKLEILPKK